MWFPFINSDDFVISVSLRILAFSIIYSILPPLPSFKSS
jgi:hypothetical protein